MAEGRRQDEREDAQLPNILGPREALCALSWVEEHVWSY